MPVPLGRDHPEQRLDLRGRLSGFLQDPGQAGLRLVAGDRPFEHEPAGQRLQGLAGPLALDGEA